MAILESVRELASKLGAETNGRDITDQINKINKHLDETALGGRDIADAVRTYSKNASGGSFSKIACPIGIYTNNDIVFYNTRIYRSQNGAYDVGMSGAPANLKNKIMVLIDPLVSISNLSSINGGAIMMFTPAQQCEIATQVELTGDEIENGDGKGYAIKFSREAKLTGTVYKIIDSYHQHIDWNTDIVIE